MLSFVFAFCSFLSILLRETAVCLSWTLFAPNRFPPYITTNFYSIRSRISSIWCWWGYAFFKPWSAPSPHQQQKNIFYLQYLEKWNDQPMTRPVGCTLITPQFHPTKPVLLGCFHSSLGLSRLCTILEERQWQVEFGITKGLWTC